MDVFGQWAVTAVTALAFSKNMIRKIVYVSGFA